MFQLVCFKIAGSAEVARESDFWVAFSLFGNFQFVYLSWTHRIHPQLRTHTL